MLPTPYILKETAKVADLQDPTREDEQERVVAGRHHRAARRPGESAKKIRSAVTDSGREVTFDEEEKPGVSNLLTIFSALSGRSVDDIVDGLRRTWLRRPEEGSRGPRRGLRHAVRGPHRSSCSDDPAELTAILAEGAARARAVASVTLADVYERIGFVPAV